MLYTAQYRYTGRDRLDITVKGNNIAGKNYAPTWSMVNLYNHGGMTEEQYTATYYELLLDRYIHMRDFKGDLSRLLEMVQDRDVTLVCFCPKDAFCHRHLLVKWLLHNWCPPYPNFYGGERQ